MQKLRALPGLIYGEKALTGPFYANVDPTHRCNMRCPYCRWHSPLVTKPLLDAKAPLDLDPEIFECFCKDLEEMGCRSVLLVGAGEPALHPHFLQLLESTQRHRLRTTVYTNGTLFRRYGSSDLIQSGLALIRFSLADSSADRYHARHPYLKAGTFEANLSALRGLVESRQAGDFSSPKIELCVPLDRENMWRLDEMVDLGIRIGIDRLLFSVVLDFGQENLSHYELQPDEVCIVRSQLEKIRMRLNRTHIGHNIGDVLLRYKVGRSVLKTVPCYSSWFYCFLDVAGQVKVCQRDSESMGDLRRQCFREIWNGPGYRAFRGAILRRPESVAGGRFDCSFCPHLPNNHRIDRVIRWIPRVFARGT